jgi:hypothetical protein
MWYLSFWLRSLAPYFLHRHGPDAARHAADHGVFRVHAVAEEEGQVGREVVDVHAARQVRLDQVKPLDSVKASWLIGLAPASAM